MKYTDAVVKDKQKEKSMVSQKEKAEEMINTLVNELLFDHIEGKVESLLNVGWRDGGIFITALKSKIKSIVEEEIDRKDDLLRGIIRNKLSDQFLTDSIKNLNISISNDEY